MAAPVLQAQGATVAATTGTLSPTIPTHQANDVIIVAAVFWGPNTAGDAAQIPTPTNYTLLSTQVGQPGGTRDGWSALFWRRVTDAGTTVTVNRGASWDTGTDTCFGARAYVIRGCVTTGNPFENVATPAGPYTAANQAFAAQTVSGSERMVVHFGGMMDNAAFAMTASGWTTGTEDNDATGTDCSFQTARKDNVSANTAADTATVSAPVQGAYAFHGVVFIAPVDVTTDQTITGVGRIEKTVDQTVTALARITATTDRTVTAVARIQKTVDQTVTALARITATTDQTIAALARITATTDQTIAALARITATTDRTITAVANISTETVTDRTVTAVGRIEKTVDQTLTALGRIEKTVDQAVTALGRIQKVVDATISALAKIEGAVDQTITARARIEGTTDRTINAIGAILKTVDQTVSALARIAKIVDATLDTRARIEVQTSQTVTAKGNILGIGIDKTITATAKIQLPAITWTSYSFPQTINQSHISNSIPTLVVYMRATAGTVYARLYSTNDGSFVGQVQTNSTDFVLLQSSTLTLKDDHTYRLQLGVVSGSAGEILYAAIDLAYTP